MLVRATNDNYFEEKNLVDRKMFTSENSLKYSVEVTLSFQTF